MMLPHSEFTEALVEQHIAEMTDREFAALISRTRPPTELLMTETEHHQ
ncbi:MAG: hypothetical protein ACLP9Y_05255 [Mycobacterium sp.]